jgi:hypothetical protein
MRSALQRSRISQALRQQSRLFGLVTLIVLPFSGCFAEPKPEMSPPGAGASGGTTDSGGTGGTHAMSSGGKPSSSGGTSGDTQNTAGVDDNGGTPPDVGGSSSQGNTGNIPVTSGSFKCHGPKAQPLPARAAVMSTKVQAPAPPPSVLTITKQQLFTNFQQTCGINSSCHVGQGDPNAQPHLAFKVTIDTFDQRTTLGDEAMMRVTSSDKDVWMPPDDGDGSKRKAGNPLYDLASHLLAWQDSGFKDSFTVAADSGGDSTPVTTTNPYLLSPDLGKALTNIGSCVPDNLTDAAIMGNPVGGVVKEMDDKDQFFAGLQTSDDLPDTIFETDLVTLDSTALAQRRVFSYAPTYPLYSDHAGKMRYVRVPVGETIHYDEKLHDFTIPDNTRFYKTFLKPVKDKDGNTGWRKMETRLIVVRQDSQNSDGSFTTHALRASYAWDKDEQMAHRVKDPFRDGTAARDRLCPVIVDESTPRDKTKNPISDSISSTCEYMTQAEMDDPKSGVIRHYAIPSTQRCDQCHMGSSSHSYVLGFTPWQVDRRKSGEGGVFEDPNTDELTQLQRFLDYGIIDGIKPGDVKLEESQLIADPPRSPRNDYELTAQAYMMGNCAFCHNPHGYPVVTNPILKEFELFPSETGGIFQFPLDKYSPRAKGGKAQAVRIPYISSDFTDVILPDPEDAGNEARGVPIPMGPQGDPPIYPVLDATSGHPPDYDLVKGFTFLGPWRSLIWRNTYTPFTYNEDGTLYIHMPRNVAGFDCRVADIMAKWMVSIPVVMIPDKEQPMQEVSATDPSQAYALGQAEIQANVRVKAYEGSVTGQWCPADDDIVDPSVILSPLDENTGTHTQLSPIDAGFPPGPRVNTAYDFTAALGNDGDGVPDHAHWIPTDITESPGKWIPRRQNWQDFLVKRDIQVSDDLDAVIDDLQSVHLSDDLQEFALDELPMGLWQTDCQSTPDAQATPTVQQILTDLPNHPHSALTRWLTGDVFRSEPQPNGVSHVHFQSRGEAVFRAICQNCHGPQIDSKSALAATIQELTGGTTRVANFIAGLFGPPSAPGAYAHDEFLIGDGVSPDDWQARYVLFMGLGGTGANIPISVLSLVANSPFYGNGVRVPGAKNPNMLGSAQQLCYFVLADTRQLGAHGPQFEPLTEVNFVPGVGHYELWESLCTHGNEPVVHVYTADTPPLSNQVYRAKDDAGNWVYPTSALVGTNEGEIETGIQPTNIMPWCIKRPQNATEQGKVDAWATTAQLTDQQVPYCPDQLFAQALDHDVYRLAFNPTDHTADPTVPFGNADFTSHWLRHGAMNAGLSAFYFMRGFAEHALTPDKTFDFCLQ